MFTSYGRAGVKKVLIAFTDGYTRHDNEATLNQAMIDLRAIDVEVFLVLVSSSTSATPLSGLAMYPHFVNDPAKGFQAADWNSLGDVQQAVENSICSA